MDNVTNGFLMVEALLPLRWICSFSTSDLGIKAKEKKSIYIAPFCSKVHTKRSGMDHTVLPANNTMPAFPS